MHRPHHTIYPIASSSHQHILNDEQKHYQRGPPPTSGYGPTQLPPPQEQQGNAVKLTGHPVITTTAAAGISIATIIPPPPPSHHHLQLAVVFDARTNKLEEYILHEMRRSAFGALLQFVDRATAKTSGASNSATRYGLSLSLHIIIGNTVVQQFPLTNLTPNSGGSPTAEARVNGTPNKLTLNFVREEIVRQQQLAAQTQQGKGSAARPAITSAAPNTNNGPTHTIIHAETDPAKLHCMAMDHITKAFLAAMPTPTSTAVFTGGSGGATPHQPPPKLHRQLLIFSCAGTNCGLPSSLLQQKASQLLLGLGGGAPTHTHHRHPSSSSSSAPLRIDLHCFTQKFVGGGGGVGSAGGGVATPLSPFMTMHRHAAAGLGGSGEGIGRVVGAALVAPPRANGFDDAMADTALSLFSPVALATNCPPPTSGPRGGGPQRPAAVSRTSSVPILVAAKRIFDGVHRLVVGEYTTTVELVIGGDGGAPSAQADAGNGGGLNGIVADQHPLKKRRLQLSNTTAGHHHSEAAEMRFANGLFATSPPPPIEAVGNESAVSSVGAIPSKFVAATAYPFRKAEVCVSEGHGPITINIVGVASTAEVDEERLFGLPWSARLSRSYNPSAAWLSPQSSASSTGYGLPAQPFGMAQSINGNSSSSYYSAYRPSAALGQNNYYSHQTPFSQLWSVLAPHEEEGGRQSVGVAALSPETGVLLCTTSSDVLRHHYGLAVGSDAAASHPTTSSSSSSSSSSPTVLTLIAIPSADGDRVIFRGFLSDELMGVLVGPPTCA